MFEIANYQIINHLLKDITFEKSLVYSVLEGTHDGKIVVDDINHPQCAIVCTKVNYFFVLGSRLNKGFATLVAKAFINECIKRHKKPNWACWPYNEGSIQLALKCGFQKSNITNAIYWDITV